MNTSVDLSMSSSFDDLDHQYSADFSEEINTKMRIPDRLSMGAGDDSMNVYDVVNDHRHTGMEVPERIVMAGSDEHMGMKRPPPNIDFDAITPNPVHTTVGLTTPPRTLTLEEFNFPTAGETRTKSKPLDEKQSRLVPSVDGLVQDASIDTDRLHHQILQISQRILELENENQQRRQREKYLYITGAVYILYKAMKYLFGST
ncbi:transport and Golgi organization protein 11-like [Anneissia japonica]|uniref:transport and Golgi organization protein 11-like n=1 Tax=Anneissia japonica TaxID=1529436 RepID=UPI001425881A|nr:transport and Golgi organization protein 11-like [Anneissia japonica]XP_033109695.1 transport and Golgi organization protein 11-like [Anneissia japonica]